MHIIVVVACNTFCILHFIEIELKKNTICGDKHHGLFVVCSCTHFISSRVQTHYYSINWGAFRELIFKIDFVLFCPVSIFNNILFEIKHYLTDPL